MMRIQTVAPTPVAGDYRRGLDISANPEDVLPLTNCGDGTKSVMTTPFFIRKQADELGQMLATSLDKIQRSTVPKSTSQSTFQDNQKDNRDKVVVEAFIKENESSEPLSRSEKESSADGKSRKKKRSPSRSRSKSYASSDDESQCSKSSSSSRRKQSISEDEDSDSNMPSSSVKSKSSSSKKSKDGKSDRSRSKKEKKSLDGESTHKRDSGSEREATGKKERRPKRGIQFAETAEVYAVVPRLSQYTPDEKFATWIAEQEFEEIIEECEKTVDKMEMGKRCKDKKYSSLGLEHWTEQGSRRKERIRDKAMNAVMEEQDWQNEVGNSSWTPIADAYSEQSADAQLEATEKALQIQKDVEKYIAKDISTGSLH